MAANYDVEYRGLKPSYYSYYNRELSYITNMSSFSNKTVIEIGTGTRRFALFIADEAK